MGTTPPSCPGCDTPMETVKAPDLQYEQCPRCDGVFLDRGELNALATELAGDIEYCSVEVGEEVPDAFPVRTCPRCPGQTMTKEDLLVYSGVVFDHCESCRGWFLDRGELRAMNEALAEVRRSGEGDAEYRGMHRGHLVTVTEATTVVSQSGPLGVAAAAPATWRRVEVYLLEPLGVGLRVSPETWASWLWGLLGADDVQTGDDAFDKTFLVRAERPTEAVRRLDGSVRKALLDFHASRLAQLGKKHTFQVLDDRLLFAYSDWGDAADRPHEADVQALIESLVGVAAAIDPPQAA